MTGIFAFLLELFVVYACRGVVGTSLTVETATSKCAFSDPRGSFSRGLVPTTLLQTVVVKLDIMTSKKPRGFAVMDPKRVSEIASKGGKAAHVAGTAHEFTREEAREAGRKGGHATHAKRRAAKSAEPDDKD